MNTTVFEKWNKRFLRVAQEVSSWSRDPKRKVGCVITDMNNRILSTGYNGLPSQLDNVRVVPNSLKNNLTIHSELNCLANIHSGIDTSSLGPVNIYITYPPCVHCAKMLVANLTINKVVWLVREDGDSKWHTSMAQAKDYLWDNGVEVNEYNSRDIETQD